MTPSDDLVVTELVEAGHCLALDWASARAMRYSREKTIHGRFEALRSAWQDCDERLGTLVGVISSPSDLPADHELYHWRCRPSDDTIHCVTHRIDSTSVHDMCTVV